MKLKAMLKRFFVIVVLMPREVFIMFNPFWCLLLELRF